MGNFCELTGRWAPAWNAATSKTTDAMIHFILIFLFLKIQNPGLGEYLSLGWVITEELESCVCSSKRRSWSLYRRSGSETRKRRITTPTSRQANGRHVWNDPANERRGKFPLVCAHLLRPTVRPTDKHTNPQRPTRANGEPLLLPCGCGEKKSRVEGAYAHSVLPPNNLPAWDPKHKNNSDAGPCNIRREYRQWAATRRLTDSDRKWISHLIY